MSKAARVAVTAVGCAIALWLFVRLFAQADARAMWRALGSSGPLIALALAPFVLATTVDAYGTLALLRALARRVTLWEMVLVRIASQALLLSIPAGFIASDTATAVLLERRSFVPLGDGIVASIARKWLVMRAHAAYIVIGAIAGFPAMAALSRGPWHAGTLAWMVLASAAIPLGASWAIGAGLLGRSTFARLHTALARLPSKRLRHWLETRRHEAVATDAQAIRLRAAGGATTVATLAFLAGWCIEALESVLLLRLVGAEVAFAAVLAIEAGLSLVRSLAVLAPSGLGVVDFGYAAVLPLLGADPESAAAFVLLKRAKELAWVVAGYGILGAMGGRSPRLAPAPVAPATATPPWAGPLGG
jgi:uncharacterized membrane protein YbhN (UPF0104 family)